MAFFNCFGAVSKVKNQTFFIMLHCVFLNIICSKMQVKLTFGTAPCLQGRRGFSCFVFPAGKINVLLYSGFLDTPVKLFLLRGSAPAFSLHTCSSMCIHLRTCLRINARISQNALYPAGCRL